ncbi:DUF4157 domain-containing protein [Leptolyngbya sp. GB1-A1]|uniref:eCIS core domain-containing protein n=1 Tax=Leptolyngbya sp. GB1-A1 TaxID=2933908 RepID=UPI00329976AF
MKIRRSVLLGLFTTSIALVIAVSTLFGQSSPAKAFHPCPPFHRAEHTGRFNSVPVCVPEVPAGNIPTNPRELSEEAWGQAGQAVYRQGSEAMLSRASARGSSPRPLDEYQKRYLRPHFGNLVDNVVVFYNVPPLDDWQILGMTINNSHTDAQTFCERIFVNGQYNSTNRNQLVLLAHELMHSQQCQRVGGIERFGYEYFRAYKRANLNYDNISLEQEAYAFDARFEEWLNLQLADTPVTGVPISVNFGNTLFYDRDAGVCTFTTSNGSVIQRLTSCRRTWHLIVYTADKLLFYDRDAGQIETYRVDNRGLGAQLHSYAPGSMRRTWAQITSPQQGIIVFRDDNGQVETYRLNDIGMLQGL